MKHISVAVGAVVLGACASVGGGNWVTLVDGQSGLDNWNRVGDANWRAEGGAIVADRGKGGFLVSKNAYADFEIRVEFWAETDTNSGLFIRCATPTNPGSLGSCYEINISDPHATTPTGGIVGVHSTLPYRVKSAGKWSRFDVLADGTHLVVKVNGETLTDVNDDKFREGALGLQAGGPTGSGPIKFRNIRIRPLRVTK